MNPSKVLLIPFDVARLCRSARPRTLSFILRSWRGSRHFSWNHLAILHPFRHRLALCITIITHNSRFLFSFLCWFNSRRLWHSWSLNLSYTLFVTLFHNNLPFLSLFLFSLELSSQYLCLFSQSTCHAL